MNDKKIVETIKSVAFQSSRQNITFNHRLVKDIFDFLHRQNDLNLGYFILCASNGLILNFYSSDFGAEISGYTIPLDFLRSLENDIMIHTALKEYMIITPNKKELVPLVNTLLKDIDGLLRVFSTCSDYNQNLLHFFDSVQNSISLYDKDAKLLFANNNFCNYLQIDDREAVLGMHISDILERSKIQVFSMENNSTHLKMLDVLSNGEEVIDWEVRLESQDNPDVVQLASNDMYPVRNDNDEVVGMVEISRSHQQNMNQTRKMLGLSAEYSFPDIIGTSPSMMKTIRQAKKFAHSPFNFLVTGESGVGKELFVQSIHNYSARSKGPFVALNCASFPEGLIESELFGYVSGAFTGASKKGQIGKFELADGGTLFLDEIGELPYHFQAKLLRVLETWTVTRIGSSQPIPINVRLIAATNRNLADMIEEGLFREDLYYRLAVLNIEIPPLRERGEDILLLAENFLHQSGGSRKSFDSDTKRALLEYNWPGNVRELRNVINRTSILSKTNVITKDILKASMNPREFMLKQDTYESPEEKIENRKKDIDEAYANLLREALEITDDNRKEAAELIGVSRKTFYRLMDKYF